MVVAVSAANAFPGADAQGPRIAHEHHLIKAAASWVWLFGKEGELYLVASVLSLSWNAFLNFSSLGPITARQYGCRLCSL